ncbi:MAG: hypothetical protein ACYCQJ_01715 [Nitrososphaerales archaeon]
MAIENKTRLIPAIAASLSLLTLYLFFLNYFVVALVFSGMSEIESLIFYTMIFRVIGVTFIPYLKRIHPQIKILIFSFETFILVLLIVAYVFTKDPSYNLLMGNILTAWLGVSIVVLTPYAIYSLGLSMRNGASITSTVLSGAPEIAVGLFLASLVFRIRAMPNGLASFGTMIIASLRAQPGIGQTPSATSNPIISISSTIFFIAIFTYVILEKRIPTSAFSTLPKFQYILALMLLGILALYLWTFSSQFFDGNIFIIFTAPSIIISIALWVLARG